MVLSQAYNAYSTYNKARRMYRTGQQLHRAGGRLAGSGPRLRGTARKQQKKNSRFIKELTSREQLGRAAGQTTCKRHSSALVNDSVSAYALNSYPLIEVSHANGSSANRERNIANVRGVELHMGFQSEMLRNVACVNVAVVIPKPGFNPDEGGFIGTTNWWTSPNPTNLEGYARNFTATQSQLEYDTLSINSTGYNVIWRKKFKLMPLEQYGDFVNPESSIQILGSQFQIDEYIKIDKQMDWSNQQQNFPRNNAYVVWWVSKFNDPDAPGREPLAAQATVTMRRTTHFREPGEF